METLAVPANGLSFGALSWGSQGDPLVLLAHGYPDTAHSWRHVGPALAAQGRYVVAPFMRGYAPTEVPADGRYRARVLAEDLVALRDALGGDDGAVLVGHDWGGYATYAVTSHSPLAFRRYVVLAVPPPVAVLTPFASLRTLPIGLRQLRHSWYLAANQLPGTAGQLDRLVPRHWRDWSPGYEAEQDVEHVLDALGTPARRRAALAYYRQNLTGGGALEGFRSPLRAPVLYVHGQDDGCLLADVAERATLPPGSRFVLVPGAGHFVHLERPDRVVELVEEWIG